MEGDALVYFVGKVLVGLTGIATLAVLARGLGVESYGRYGVGVASIVWVVQMSAGWAQQSILRYQSRWAPTQPKALERTRIVAGILSAAVGTAIGGIVLASPFDGGTAIAATLVVPLWATFVLFAATAQSALRPGVVALGDVLRTGLPFLGYVVLWTMRGTLSLQDVFTMLAAGYAVTLVLMTWRLGAHPSPADPTPTPTGGHGNEESAATDVHRPAGRVTSSPTLRTWLAFGVPYTLWFAASGLHPLVGRYAISIFGSDVQLGLFSFWQDIATRGTSLLLLPLTTALHARVMVAYNADDTAQARRLLVRALALVAVASLVAAVASWVASPYLSRILLGGASAAPEVRWLLPALVVTEALAFVGILLQKRLEAAERTGIMAVMMASSTLLIAVLAWILTPILGMVGVVVALVVGRSTYVGATLWTGRGGVLRLTGRGGDGDRSFK